MEQNSQAVKVCKKHGLRVMGFFMIGSPTETEEDIIETFNFIKNHNLDQISVFITSPYPATFLWDYLKGKGIVKDETFDLSKLTMGSRMKLEDMFLVADSINLNKFRELYLELVKYAEEVNEKKRLYLLSLRWINPHMIKVAM